MASMQSIVWNQAAEEFIHGYAVMIYQACGLDKKTRSGERVFGAGSRGRTDTVLLPSDFESDASANSTIPA